MSTGKLNKETRKELKSEIESLLNNISSDPVEDLLIDNDLSNELQRESKHDFEDMSDKFTQKAKNITDSLFKNFVDIGIFEKNDYAKHKKELDTINISNLFFQLKTLKITVIKIMEEISAGNTHPRLLEVMGQLQDKMANITKMQANYILFLEDTYKKLNDEYPVNPDDSKVPSKESEGKFFISIGTKNVIENLPETSDPSIKVESSDNLVNPNNKINLMKNNNIEVEENKENDDDFIDLTEII